MRMLWAMPVSVTGDSRRKRPRCSHLRHPRHHLRLAPDRVIGIHVNGSIGYFDGDMDEATAAALTPLEQDRIARAAEFMEKEFGYIVIQSTRPSLIGAMTADSPVAQFSSPTSRRSCATWATERHAMEHRRSGR